MGIHPHDSKDVTKDYLKDLEVLALSSKKVVAVGEIGKKLMNRRFQRLRKRIRRLSRWLRLSKEKIGRAHV